MAGQPLGGCTVDRHERQQPGFPDRTPTPANNAGLSLRDGMDLSGMTYDELWIRQVSVGGTAGEVEVEAYVLGLLDSDDFQHDLLAQALNEYFLERGQDHPVGYTTVVAAR
jgi:hypothetical protein